MRVTVLNRDANVQCCGYPRPIFVGAGELEDEVKVTLGFRSRVPPLQVFLAYSRTHESSSESGHSDPISIYFPSCALPSTIPCKALSSVIYSRATAYVGA